MIRRGPVTPVGKSTRASLYAWHARSAPVFAVKRGQSVRIQGLGTLARVAAPIGAVYRLTLTAAVARGACSQGLITLDGCPMLDDHVHADTRRLARALGAPVEVYAPGRAAYGSTATGRAPTLLTTVSP